MASQGVIAFPCRKSRRALIQSKVSTSPKKEGSLQRKALAPVSNLQNGRFNPSAHSVMPHSKSPRKRFSGEEVASTKELTSEDLLNELFKLSPQSPLKRFDENCLPDPGRRCKSPLKNLSKLPNSSLLMSPTRTILSPIRTLSLNSPENSPGAIARVETKRAKILQLKLSRIDLNSKISPDKTPIRVTRNRRNLSVLLREETPSSKLAADRTPPVQSRRPARTCIHSTKEVQRLRLLENEEENIAPDTLSPSPSKKSRSSPEHFRLCSARRTLIPPISPQKPKVRKSNDSPAKKLKTPEKVPEDMLDNEERFVSSTPSNGNAATPRTRRILQMHKPDAMVYQRTKRALHSSIPDDLVGREEEISSISRFISSGVENHASGSLYISGAPGTGKSACLMKVLADDKVTGASAKKSKVISVNCMSMRNSAAIYSKLAMEMGAKPAKCKTARSSSKYLETELTSEGPLVILLLDEMDQLDSKNQEVLYTIFEWPALENSRLLLIGIANALDLTDRILPRLQSRIKCKPTLINFKPYTKDQIVAILEGRINQMRSDGVRVIDVMAVQFCARKVSAVAGDARKALDVCRRAVEVVETSIKSRHVLSPSGRENGSSLPKTVGLKQIAGVLSNIYESSISNIRPVSPCKQEQEAFPLQQKLAICTLILLTRHVKCKEVTLGKLHEAYGKVCRKRQVSAVGQSEFISLIQLIETRGVVGTKPNKQMRLSKVFLALRESDVEHALRDKTLLSAILQEGLPK